ncbi:MAG: ribonuclease P protein component [Muribaculaceae bacterium]|nr:ribonuclease P protein component [Muribaculaceae bacterium]
MTEESSLTAAESQRFTLRKSAKLRHRTLVNDLFRKGKSVYAGPLRVTFRTLSAEELAASFRTGVPDLTGPVQMMITVPKKKRRHAVDRVLMRRRIREAFRLQWHVLRRQIADDPEVRTLSLGFVYLLSENIPQAEVSEAMAQALAKIRKKLGAPVEGAANV